MKKHEIDASEALTTQGDQVLLPAQSQPWAPVNAKAAKSAGKAGSARTASAAGHKRARSHRKKAAAPVLFPGLVGDNAVERSGEVAE